MEKNEIKEYVERYSEFRNHVLDAVKKYGEIYDNRGSKFVDEITEIYKDPDGNYQLEMRGDETWRYGGYEDHYLCLDARWLYDEDFIEEKRQEEIERKEQEIKEKQLAKVKLAKQKEEKERKLYHQLKDKFEDEK